MVCPECSTPYACPCDSCVSRNPDAVVWPMVSEEDQSCSGCGLTKNVNEWMDIEYEQYKQLAE